jgi:hypothetical protein
MWLKMKKANAGISKAGFGQPGGLGPEILLRTRMKRIETRVGVKPIYPGNLVALMRRRNRRMDCSTPFGVEDLFFHATTG